MPQRYITQQGMVLAITLMSILIMSMLVLSYFQAAELIVKTRQYAKMREQLVQVADEALNTVGCDGQCIQQIGDVTLTVQVEPLSPQRCCYAPVIVAPGQIAKRQVALFRVRVMAENPHGQQVCHLATVSRLMSLQHVCDVDAKAFQLGVLSQRDCRETI